MHIVLYVSTLPLALAASAPSGDGGDDHGGHGAYVSIFSLGTTVYDNGPALNLMFLIVILLTVLLEMVMQFMLHSAPAHAKKLISQLNQELMLLGMCEENGLNGAMQGRLGLIQGMTHMHALKIGVFVFVGASWLLLVSSALKWHMGGAI